VRAMPNEKAAAADPITRTRRTASILGEVCFVDMVDRLVGLMIHALKGVSEAVWFADETRRTPDDQDAAFSSIVLDILSVPVTVMPVQLKLGAEAALAKKAGVDADQK
jgi:hypothetical protein